jgi:hypothetical protein
MSKTQARPYLVYIALVALNSKAMLVSERTRTPKVFSPARRIATHLSIQARYFLLPERHFGL